MHILCLCTVIIGLLSTCTCMWWITLILLGTYMYVWCRSSQWCSEPGLRLWAHSRSCLGAAPWCSPRLVYGRHGNWFQDYGDGITALQKDITWGIWLIAWILFVISFEFLKFIASKQLCNSEIKFWRRLQYFNPKRAGLFCLFHGRGGGGGGFRPPLGSRPRSAEKFWNLART